MVWAKIFCLAFCEYFGNLAEFWPNLNVVAHSGIKHSNVNMCILTSRFLLLTVEITQFNIPNPVMEIVNNA